MLIDSMKQSISQFLSRAASKAEDVVEFLKECKEYENTEFDKEFKIFYPETKKKYLKKAFIKLMFDKLSVDKYSMLTSSFTTTAGVSALK